MFKKTLIAASLVLLIACSGLATAAPPYDITYTYNPPSTGGTVVGVNAYVDDCDPGGSLGAPAATVDSGVPISNLITADGIYDFCARSFNNTGEQPDPGVIVTVSINQEPLPGPIESLDITVTCRDTSGNVISCADSGVTVTLN